MTQSWGDSGGPVADGGWDDDGQGQTRGAGFPGLKNMFIQPGMQGQQFNAVKYMAQASRKPWEYLPMTRLTAKEISRDARIISMLNLVNFGHMDIPYVMAWTYWAKIGEDGQGRDEVVKMVTGGMENLRQQGRFNNMRNRMRGIGPSRNNNQDMGGTI